MLWLLPPALHKGRASSHPSPIQQELGLWLSQGTEMQSVSLSHHWLPQFLLVHPVVALGKDSQGEVAAMPPVPLTGMVQTQGDLSVLLEVPSPQCLGVRSNPHPRWLSLSPEVVHYTILEALFWSNTVHFLKLE